MADKRIDDIVLYHGSLAELNSRDPGRQYRFAEDLEFVSRALRYRENLSEMYDLFREELREKGYDGLVNKTLLVTGDTLYLCKIVVEGTPIVRVKKR